MEFTQFIAYLDYGVLGLSAIILILSFVLLSREQKRDIFRPEVASAIRKYMMLALAFAGVGLVSTIVEGVMVNPTKAEQKVQDERMELLSEMVAKEMERRIYEANSGLINSDTIADTPEPEGEDLYSRVKQSLFGSFYDFRADKTLFKQSLDKLSKDHESVGKTKEKILGDYDEIANLREKWLEEKAIPAVEKSIKEGEKKPNIIIDLPSELVQSPNVNKAEVLPNLDQLQTELKMLKESKKKK